MLPQNSILIAFLWLFNHEFKKEISKKNLNIYFIRRSRYFQKSLFSGIPKNGKYKTEKNQVQHSIKLNLNNKPHQFCFCSGVKRFMKIFHKATKDACKNNCKNQSTHHGTTWSSEFRTDLRKSKKVNYQNINTWITRLCPVPSPF